MEENMNEKERHDIKLATIYELRLAIKESKKTEYTKEEILEMLDTIALSKSQK